MLCVQVDPKSNLLSISKFKIIKLVDRHLERIQIIVESIQTCLVINTIHYGSVVRPQWTGWEFANLLICSSKISLQNGGIESCGRISVFNPVNHDSKVGLWERSVGLGGVVTTMSCAWNEVQFVPIAEGGDGGVVSHVSVHDLADGVVVAD